MHNARWLDIQLSERLAHYFGVRPSLQPEWLEGGLRFWQWHKLASTMLAAASHSAHYAKTLGAERAVALLRHAAQKAGLPQEATAVMEYKARRASGLARSLLPVNKRYAYLTDAHIREKLRRATTLVLAELEHTLPSDLANAPDSFLAVSHSAVSGVISLPTSGTTGPCKRIFCTEEDLADTIAFFRHGMQFMLQPEQGALVVLLMSGERPGSVGDLLMRAMRELNVPCHVLGFMPPTTEGENIFLKQLCTLAPSCIVGMPGQLFRLARHPLARKLARRIRSVLLSGDVVVPPLRKAISEGFGGCEVFLHYGLTETGLGGAVECYERNGCHTRDADLYYEIVDKNGVSVTAGNWGDIVITTLTRRAAPLLCYRTGDEGRILPERCACGSVFARLETRGRISSQLPLPQGKSLYSADIDRALSPLPFVQEYDTVLHEYGKRRCLVLTVHCRDNGINESRQEQVEQAVAALPGLLPVRKEICCLQKDSPCLPVLVHVRGKRDKGQNPGHAALRPGGKRQIRRSNVPPEYV